MSALAEKEEEIPPEYRKQLREWNLRTLLWNVEGLGKMLEVGAAVLFDEHDILVLVETLSTKEANLNGFYTFDIRATAPLRAGRPIGGVTVAVKPFLNPKLLFSSGDTICIETEAVTVLASYFNPERDIESLIDDLASSCFKTPSSKPLLFAGDYNVRADRPHAQKTRDFQGFMSDIGCRLLNNDPCQYTYLCAQGRSTIDLIFSNKSFSSSDTCSPIDGLSFPRKHIPVAANLFFHSVPPRPPPATRRKRLVDASALQAVDAESLADLVSPETVNDAFFLAKEALLSCVPKLRPFTPMPPRFFDEECHQARERVRRLQRESIRSSSCLVTLAEERRHFRRLLNDKKCALREKEQLILAGEAEKRPWKFDSRRNGFIACPIPLERWTEHFGTLYDPSQAEPDFSSFLPIDQDPDVQESSMNRLFTREEIETVILRSKDRKGLGPDGLANEHMKGSLQVFSSFWLALWNCMFSSGVLVEEWRTCTLKVLFKGKGSLTDPGCYRGIALLPHTFKMYTKLLAHRLLSVIHDTLPDEQFGFLPGRSVYDAFAVLRTHVKASLSRPRCPLYCVFVDYSKAFDSVPREGVVEKLQTFHGVKGVLLRAICSVLKSNYVMVDDGLRQTDPIRQTQGVLQGDSLSPLLFISYLSDLPHRLQVCGVTVVLYADDLLFLSENKFSIHKALRALEKWTYQNGMRVNVDKTKVVKFRRGGKLEHMDVFFYDGEEIEVVNSFEYLGITVQPTWTFTEHLRKRVLKTILRANSIPNLSKLSISAAKKYWSVMVEPVATYGITSIWEDLTAPQLEILDRAKFSFFKRVMCLPRSASNRKVAVMSNIASLSEELLSKRRVLPTDASHSHLNRYESRMDELDPTFFLTPAITQKEWENACYPKRHVVTRFSAHGFHYFLCTDSCDEPSSLCECRFCGSECVLLHGLECVEFPCLNDLVLKCDSDAL